MISKNHQMTLGELSSAEDNQFIRSTIINGLKNNSDVIVTEEELTQAIYWASTNRLKEHLLHDYLKSNADEEAENGSLFPWSHQREIAGFICDCPYATDPKNIPE